MSTSRRAFLAGIAGLTGPAGAEHRHSAAEPGTATRRSGPRRSTARAPYNYLSSPADIPPRALKRTTAVARPAGEPATFGRHTDPRSPESSCGRIRVNTARATTESSATKESRCHVVGAIPPPR